MQQLYEFLQECDELAPNPQATGADVTGADSKVLEERATISGVVGTTTEFVESDKTDIITDHMYHKKVLPVKTSAILPPISARPDDQYQLVCLDNISVENTSLLSPPTPDLWDMGSDGNKSPSSSDCSSLGSPYSSQDMNFDWNESFTDLFPELV